MLAGAAPPSAGSAPATMPASTPEPGRCQGLFHCSSQPCVCAGGKGWWKHGRAEALDFLKMAWVRLPLASGAGAPPARPVPRAPLSSEHCVRTDPCVRVCRLRLVLGGQLGLGLPCVLGGDSGGCAAPRPLPVGSGPPPGALPASLSVCSLLENLVCRLVRCWGVFPLSRIPRFLQTVSSRLSSRLPHVAGAVPRCLVMLGPRS